MIAEYASWLWLIPFLPLMGAAVNKVVGPKAPRAFVHWLACLTVLGSFIVTLYYAIAHVAGMEGDHVLINEVFTWLEAGDLTAKASFQLDRLSTVMALVVSGVGFLIHVYSIGYMHDDPRYSDYFTYLNLFAGAMLILVLSSNLPLMFIGWEGVGLCSYLLIGFWFEDEEKAKAGKKAFIVNRIGDFGFLVGMFALFFFIGKLDFLGLQHAIEHEGARDVLTAGWFSLGGLGTPMVVTVICLCFFLGATGKSAQLPLYVWLPDAMAGPTPVSALIHAATMVTAGVYMVARLNFMFALSSTACLVVATVGALTAFYSATIAITQNDIKKVLAYSTVSQLGYMFVGVGVMAYSAGIFHLMTHAFFKACLFLGSGSVIHAMGGEQDMRRMGGLKKYMPHTYWTFLFATIAIAGIPPFSGFFSKDEILWKAWSHGHPVVWALCWLGAGVTAFYMFRLLFMTFHGECRADEETKRHLHESPPTMTSALIVLGVLSLVGGFVGVPAIFGGANRFEHFLEPVFEAAGPALAHVGEHSHAEEWVMVLLSVAIAAAGILLAYFLYMVRKDAPAKVAEAVEPLYKLSLNKYYVDEIYEAGIVEPIRKTSDFFLWRFFDVWIIDGAVNGVARLFRYVLGEGLRRLQSGVVNSYAVYFLLGALLILGYVLWP